MKRDYIFDKNVDSENLAFDIADFLKKWGMWQDVQIFTGGKCYSDGENGEINIREEEHPEKYLKGFVGVDCNGESEWEEFSNPERLLDMTFEGPLSSLLRYNEYEVRIGDVSEQAKDIIFPPSEYFEEEAFYLLNEFNEEHIGWDPAEYDSYEDWLELNQFDGINESFVEIENTIMKNSMEFSTKEEYEDFLDWSAITREYKLLDYFKDYAFYNAYGKCNLYYNNDMFFDGGHIADDILEEFNKLLKKYGLWYELGFSWSLTTYRI